MYPGFTVSKPKGTPKGTDVRVVFERSIMVNNDEVAFVVPASKLRSFLEHVLPMKSFGVLRCARLMHEDEPDYGSPSYASTETWTHLTLALDDIFKFQQAVRQLGKAGLSLENALAMIICQEYYDCMSGGMGFSTVALCRVILKSGQIPIDSDECFRRFLRDTQKHESRESQVRLMVNSEFQLA